MNGKVPRGAGVKQLDECDLAAVLAGKAPAWRAFHAAAQALMRAVVVRALGSRLGLLDDVVQDCFLRLCRDDFAALRRFDPLRGRLSTWLGAVAAHAAADALRRQPQGLEPIEAVHEDQLVAEAARDWHLKLPAQLLTARQALVLTLLFEDDLDPDEVAVFLKINVQTVRSIKHQALARLRAAYELSPNQEVQHDPNRP